MESSVFDRIRRFSMGALVSVERFSPRALKEALRELNAAERLAPALAFAFAAVFFLYQIAIAAPAAAPTPTVLKIHAGESLAEVSSDLKKEGLVRFAAPIDLIVRLLGGSSRVRAGTYFFPSPQNLLVVASRLMTGDFRINLVRVTVPEGATSADIAAILDRRLKPFDSANFLALAKGKEGMLYPDTYFFYADEDPADVESAMEDTFKTHLAQIAPQIAASGHSLQEALTMASILIGEARTDEDRRMVASILWRRIAQGMPLQVDAPFGYVLNKKLTNLTPNDLRMDSAYNTYKNKGLPPTPIGNPTEEAILAAVSASSTPYLYYLSDSDGNMHYSATYAQHTRNIDRYLR